MEIYCRYEENNIQAFSSVCLDTMVDYMHKFSRKSTSGFVWSVHWISTKSSDCKKKKKRGSFSFFFFDFIDHFWSSVYVVESGRESHHQKPEIRSIMAVCVLYGCEWMIVENGFYIFPHQFSEGPLEGHGPNFENHRIEAADQAELTNSNVHYSRK